MRRHLLAVASLGLLAMRPSLENLQEQIDTLFGMVGGIGRVEIVVASTVADQLYVKRAGLPLLRSDGLD